MGRGRAGLSFGTARSDQRPVAGGGARVVGGRLDTRYGARHERLVGGGGAPKHVRIQVQIGFCDADVIVEEAACMFGVEEEVVGPIVDEMLVHGEHVGRSDQRGWGGFTGADQRSAIRRISAAAAKPAPRRNAGVAPWWSQITPHSRLAVRLVRPVTA